MRSPSFALGSLIVASLFTSLTAQTIYSQYPSRTNVIAFSEASPLDGTSNHTRKHPDLEVLAFVTPWNQDGYFLSEAYRGRLDSVSPVWYSLKPAADTLTKYSVVGGPPRPEDIAWYKRLSQPGVDQGGEDRVLPPLKILPRFRFEDWELKDYERLLGSSFEGMALAENIMMEVTIREYDGIVLESGAMWALKEPIKVLADRLHEVGKEIVVVMAALRHDSYSAETDKLISSGIKELASIVDKVQVMTYDFTGPEGTPFDPSSLNLPSTSDSILLRDGIRIPGPNAPLTYLEKTLKFFAELELATAAAAASSPLKKDPLSNMGLFDEFQEPIYNHTVKGGAMGKLMMGIAMYGYSYPLAHVHINGHTQAVSPPTSPTTSKDNSTEEQEKYRAKALQRESITSMDSARILAHRGDAITIREIRQVFQNGKALVRQEAHSAEAYFDYLKLKEDGSMHTREDGTHVPVAWYRRAFWPTPFTIQRRIAVIQEVGCRSVALWDIGQGGAWLLHSL